MLTTSLGPLVTHGRRGRLAQVDLLHLGRELLQGLEPASEQPDVDRDGRSDREAEDEPDLALSRIALSGFEAIEAAITAAAISSRLTSSTCVRRVPRRITPAIDRWAIAP